MKQSAQGIVPDPAIDRPNSTAVPVPPSPRSPHELRDALSRLQECGPDTDRQQVDAFLDLIVDALDERIADSAHLFAEAGRAERAEQVERAARRRWFSSPPGSGFGLLTLLGGFLTSIVVAGEVFRLSLIWASVATVNLIAAGRAARISQAPL